MGSSRSVVYGQSLYLYLLHHALGILALFIVTFHSWCIVVTHYYAHAINLHQSLFISKSKLRKLHLLPNGADKGLIQMPYHCTASSHCMYPPRLSTPCIYKGCTCVANCCIHLPNNKYPQPDRLLSSSSIVVTYYVISTHHHHTTSCSLTIKRVLPPPILKTLQAHT